MKRSIFKGAATAIITPMKNGEVDFDALRRLVDFQIDNGIDALVAAGTTGESSTLTDEEHVEVIKTVVNQAAGRVPVIAGTGSNDAAYAIKLSQDACRLGADALLLVTPYYNKATQQGLVEMYKAIAAEVDRPIILYNVPSRTGVNIEPQTYLALADTPNIVAIKEANGNISKIVETMSLVGDKLDLYSGNDDQIVPLLSLGGKGVISVLSNVLPRETSELCHAFFRGDIAAARAAQFKYQKLINALFCEVNPIPVKAAMTRLGYGDGSIRLPLTKMTAANEEKLVGLMREAGVEV
ncbi:MAG: 4-hydroxy-tetrahydrodipicolinate synthase [Clostridia bacterium]|nr:4-hydroxy-tetrahydrodipicolinate synthase [Clostridia bacterium]